MTLPDAFPHTAPVDSAIIDVARPGAWTATYVPGSLRFRPRWDLGVPTWRSPRGAGGHRWPLGSAARRAGHAGAAVQGAGEQPLVGAPHHGWAAAVVGIATAAPTLELGERIIDDPALAPREPPHAVQRRQSVGDRLPRATGGTHADDHGADVVDGDRRHSPPAEARQQTAIELVVMRLQGGCPPLTIRGQRPVTHQPSLNDDQEEGSSRPRPPRALQPGRTPRADGASPPSRDP
jgi:hypothetical protein